MSVNTLRKDFGPSFITGGTPSSPGQLAQPARTVTTSYTGPIHSLRLVDVVDPVTHQTNKVLIDVTTTGSITTTTVIPAVPYIAPVAAVPLTVVVNKNEGWNAGARSAQTMAGDGAAQFSVAHSTVGAVVGLNTQTPPAYDYHEVEHGFYFVNGLFSVIERGVERMARQGFASTDVFMVARTGSQVRYFRGTTLVYTSLVASVGTAFLDATLYTAGDEIDAASIADAIPAAAGNHGSSRASFLPLGTKAGRKFVQSVGRFLPLTASSNGKHPQGVSVRFAPLASMAGRHTAQAIGTMLPLTAKASAGQLVPRNNAAGNAMAYMLTAAQGKTGTKGEVTGRMKPFITMASNKPYGASSAALLPLTGASYKLQAINGYATLTGPGAFGLDASGEALPANSFIASASFVLTAFGGATSMLTAPHGTLTMAATIGTAGDGYLSAPGPVLVATGIAGAVGGAAMALPMGVLAAGAGATLSAPLIASLKGCIQASGTVGGVARAVLMLPLFELAVEGTVSGLSAGNLIAPMLVATPSGRAMLFGPAATLVAVGVAAVGVSPDSEGYSMNLLVDESHPNPVFAVGHYSQYPFRQVIRHAGQYYGVAADGLYLLGGDLDAGKPIPWRMKTALDDFKTKQLKRVVSAYIGGRLNEETTVGVQVGEKEENTYAYTTVHGPDAQNYRIKTGRGMRARYYGFEVGDADGMQCEVNALDLQIEVLERSI